MPRTPIGTLCSQPCLNFHTGYLVLRSPLSEQCVGSMQWQTAPTVPGWQEPHRQPALLCPRGAEEGPYSGKQCLWDLESWWEHSRGEEGGLRVAVGVLPSQHSFCPDAHLSPNSPGPHTFKPVDNWEHQSSAQGNLDFPVSMPQSGPARPPEPLKREWEPVSGEGKFLHPQAKWYICLNSGYPFWILHTYENLWN